jgi:hypothetical protein
MCLDAGLPANHGTGPASQAWSIFESVQSHGRFLAPDVAGIEYLQTGTGKWKSGVDFKFVCVPEFQRHALAIPFQIHFEDAEWKFTAPVGESDHLVPVRLGQYGMLRSRTQIDIAQ